MWPQLLSQERKALHSLGLPTAPAASDLQHPVRLPSGPSRGTGVGEPGLWKFNAKDTNYHKLPPEPHEVVIGSTSLCQKTWRSREVNTFPQGHTAVLKECFSRYLSSNHVPAAPGHRVSASFSVWHMTGVQWTTGPQFRTPGGRASVAHSRSTPAHRVGKEDGLKLDRFEIRTQALLPTSCVTLSI